MLREDFCITEDDQIILSIALAFLSNNNTGFSLPGGCKERERARDLNILKIFCLANLVGQSSIRFPRLLSSCA